VRLIDSSPYKKLAALIGCASFFFISSAYAEPRLSPQKQQELAYLKALEADRQGTSTAATQDTETGLSSLKFREGQFIKSLLRHPYAPAPTSTSFALQLRFLWYQGQSKAALALTQNHRFSSPDIDLAIARLYLSLGDYAKAQEKLNSTKTTHAALTAEFLELSSWLYFLTKQETKLRHTAKQLQEQTLYLPPQSYPGAMEQITSSTLERWLLLFPTSKELNNQLAHRYWNRGRWKQLHQLCRSNHRFSLPSLKEPICTFAKGMAQELRFREIQDQFPDLSFSRTLYKALAKRAIKQNQWEELRQIGESMTNKYPQGNEGKNYQDLAAAKASKN